MAQVAFQHLLLAPACERVIWWRCWLLCSTQIVNPCAKMERYAQERTPDVSVELNINHGNSSVFILKPEWSFGGLETNVSPLSLHKVVSGIHLPHRHLHKINLMRVAQSLKKQKLLRKHSTMSHPWSFVLMRKFLHRLPVYQHPTYAPAS